MFGLDQETITEFLPYIKEYCQGKITKENWSKLIDDIEIIENCLTEEDSRYYPILNDSLPLFFMIKHHAIIVIHKKVIPNTNLSEKIKKDNSIWNHIQKEGKIILANHIFEQGFREIDYERKCMHGRCDVFAIQMQMN